VTTIVVGPGAALSQALSALGEVVTIDVEGVEETIWQTLVALQAARPSMPEGGRIVLILPTIGLAGAAGLVDLCTAVEGIRAMAKSAARQWASVGIGVNVIAAPLSLFAAEADTTHLTAPAVPDAATLPHAVVETARFLLRSDLDQLTGDTVVVDGGAVMLP